MLPCTLVGLCLALMTSPPAEAQDPAAQDLASFEEALSSIDDGASAARKRLAVRRVIRDAGEAIEASGNNPQRKRRARYGVVKEEWC